MKLCLVAGARPNFMKLAPVVKALDRHNRNAARAISRLIVHTGQHYDRRMSGTFFEELGIPDPDVDLDVRSGSHAAQTAEIMKRFEPVCQEHKPSDVLVVGDVNSTLACALVAAKMGIRVIHVEAGLRSFDRSMPEEVNRLLTDALSDLLFTTEESANANLRREGVADSKVKFVGNVMIDTLLEFAERARASHTPVRLGLRAPGETRPRPYGLVTLHRPSNVDDRQTLTRILEAIRSVSAALPVVFTVHPRTAQRLEQWNLLHGLHWLEESAQQPLLGPGLHCTGPLGYTDFLSLMATARLVITDSGGIQEETTILGVECVTVRENTERPITVTCGTNRVVGTDTERIIEGCREALGQVPRATARPPLWDGHAAERIVSVLAAES